MILSELSLNTNILSLGGILGTTGSQQLINNINAQCGGASFFGSEQDPFRTGFHNFMTQIVQPIREAQIVMTQATQAILNPDVYRPIDSIEELEKGIPPCMQMGVIYYPPIRKMLEEERISGFGIDHKTLMKEDPYANVLKSGYVELHSTMLGPNGEYTIEFIDSTDDPELTFKDKDALRRTREYIDKFMREELTRETDFTNYPNLHG